MGLFGKKKTKQEAQKARRDGICDRIDGFVLNWRPAFAADGSDREVSEAARENLVKARGYIAAMLYKDDGRAEFYMGEIEKELAHLKDGWYTNSGGRDTVARICADIWRYAQEWANL